jgi:hypothetical protein
MAADRQPLLAIDSSSDVNFDNFASSSSPTSPSSSSSSSYLYLHNTNDSVRTIPVPLHTQHNSASPAGSSGTTAASLIQHQQAPPHQLSSTNAYPTRMYEVIAPQAGIVNGFDSAHHHHHHHHQHQMAGTHMISANAYSLSISSNTGVELEMRQLGINGTESSGSFGTNGIGLIPDPRNTPPIDAELAMRRNSDSSMQPSFVLVSALKSSDGTLRKKVTHRVSWSDDLGLPLVEVSTVPRSWDRTPVLSEIMQRKHARERQRLVAICCGVFIFFFIAIISFITVLLRLTLG